MTYANSRFFEIRRTFWTTPFTSTRSPGGRSCGHGGNSDSVADPPASAGAAARRGPVGSLDFLRECADSELTSTTSASATPMMSDTRTSSRAFSEPPPQSTTAPVPPCSPPGAARAASGASTMVRRRVRCPNGGMVPTQYPVCASARSGGASFVWRTLDPTQAARAATLTRLSTCKITITGLPAASNTSDLTARSRPSPMDARVPSLFDPSGRMITRALMFSRATAAWMSAVAKGSAPPPSPSRAPPQPSPAAPSPASSAASPVAAPAAARRRGSRRLLCRAPTGLPEAEHRRGPVP
mmetsp:Transcript_5572/g.18829  ORF Transcript_5572/g.18829 Transcript_5572/m.18829 type:complete len:297 (+) Transcript_5572:363-1253(+)